MQVNYEMYRVFYVVANTGNITKAATELNISQPAISKTIKNLEEQLGGKLFVRTKRGVILTEEGREFYSYIKQAITYINNAERKFANLMNLEIGTIRIGVSTTLVREFLLPSLEKFHHRYPKIDIQIHTDITSELFSKLRGGLIDVVITNLPIELPADIEMLECDTVQNCFVVGKKYRHLAKEGLTLDDLKKYPLIFQDKQSVTRKFLDTYLADNNVTLKPSIEMASYTLVIDFTKIGLGIGFATKEYIKSELEAGDLYVLNVQPVIPKRGIGLAMSKHQLPSFSARALIDIITKER